MHWGRGVMKLQDIAAGGDSVDWQWLGHDEALSREVQARLLALGLLDSPPDGEFGPISFWALTEWLKRAGLEGVGRLSKGVAEALLSSQAEDAFPLKPDGSLAGRIVVAMRNLGHGFCRHPLALNIVYVEGLSPDGSRNDDKPNVFNDLRMLLRAGEDGVPFVEESWVATTEPGTYYTKVKKLNPLGTARIAFGQYKSWSVGVHMAGKPSEHEALVQTAPVTVHRDLNEDFERAGDKTYTGLFGVNQHYGFDAPVDDIGRASAGCLVGRTKAGHRSFMALCKADPRYRLHKGYRFTATVLDARTL